MLRPKLVLVFAFVFLIFGANTVFACTCAGPRSGQNFQPCGLYWASEAVFIGTAARVSVEEFELPDGRKYQRLIARFAVEKAVRGVAGETVEIETNPDTGSCGYPFKEGEKYFVYTSRNKEGKFTAMMCSPIVPLKDAEVDLQYLRAIENGERGTRVYGNVFERVKVNYKQPETYQPLAGIEVVLKGKKKTFKTVTDAGGLYSFKEIPDDRYEITAKMPAHLREFVLPNVYRDNLVTIGKIESPPGETERINRCGSQNFTYTAQGVVTGKVIGHDGANPPQQSVTLVPIGENGKPDFNSWSQSVWANRETGQFLFDPVAPGKYLLAINPRNCPNQRNHEFGKMFYPGTGSETDAGIIAVTGKGEIKTNDFRLLAPLKQRRFAGVVLTADGKPLSGATVSLIDKDVNRCMNLGGLSETKTDEQGKFQLTGYESYEYRIRAFSGAGSKRLMSELTDVPAAGDFENLELTVSKTF